MLIYLNHILLSTKHPIKFQKPFYKNKKNIKKININNHIKINQYAFKYNYL